MFFFPLYDDNDHARRPLMTYALFGACVLVFLMQLAVGSNAVLEFGLIPARLFGGNDAGFILPAWMTLITATFLHGGWLHLAGNMLYLWIFADNVEDSIGRARFVVFYLLCGAVAALCHALLDVRSGVALIGASGAIAGVLGAYLLLHPRANVRCIIGFFIFFRIMNVPAFLVLGGWFVLQFFGLGGGGNVAYLAHIGGFVAGMVLIGVFKKPSVRLFGAAHSRAFATQRLVRASPHIPHIGREKSRDIGKSDDSE